MAYVSRFGIRQFLALAMLFFMGFYVHIHTIEFFAINEIQKIAEKKYHEFYNIEMAPAKPGHVYIAFPDPVIIYDQHGLKFGEVLKTPMVYSHIKKEAVLDSLLPVTLYGWVWTESLGNNNQLLTDENIRYWSNSHVIARLNAGVHLDTIYTNEKKSWTLVTFDGSIPKDNLLTEDELNDIPRWDKFFSNQQVWRTISKRSAGCAIQPTTRPLMFNEADLRWQYRLGIAIIVFTGIIGLTLRLYIPSGIKNRKRRLLRAAIAFLTGLAMGGVFWL